VAQGVNAEPVPSAAHMGQRSAATRPHLIRGPGRRPRLACEFLPRRSTWSEAAGASGMWEMRAHLATGEPHSTAPAAQYSRSRWAALGYWFPSSPVAAVRNCRPLRVYGEVRAHLAPGKFGTATQTTSSGALRGCPMRGSNPASGIDRISVQLRASRRQVLRRHEADYRRSSIARGAECLGDAGAATQGRATT
jgi:hypothetical protein